MPGALETVVDIWRRRIWPYRARLQTAFPPAECAGKLRAATGDGEDARNDIICEVNDHGGWLKPADEERSVQVTTSMTFRPNGAGAEIQCSTTSEEIQTYLFPVVALIAAPIALWSLIAFLSRFSPSGFHSDQIVVVIAPFIFALIGGLGARRQRELAGEQHALFIGFVIAVLEADILKEPVATPAPRMKNIVQ